jgi:hypothetical protein
MSSMEDITLVEFQVEGGDGHVPVPGASSVGAGGAKGLSTQVNRSGWNMIEQKLSKSEIDVIQVLSDYSIGATVNDGSTFKTIGDALYREYRPLLFLLYAETKKSTPVRVNLTNCLMPDIPIEVPIHDASVTKGKKVKKEKEIKISKIDQMRFNNSKKNVESSVKRAIDGFKLSVDNSDISFRHAMESDIAEIKGMGLLFACCYLNHFRARLNEPKHYPKVFDVLVASQRYINLCQNLKGSYVMNEREQLAISQTLLSDLSSWLVDLKTKFPFSGNNVIKHAPELIVQTNYQQVLPNQRVRAKKHQMEIVDVVKKAIETAIPAMITYDAMVGSGKTTSQIGLGNYIGYLRTANPSKYGKLRLLSVCNSESVRIDVAQKCYNAITECRNAQIKFATSYLNNKGVYKIVRSNACSSDVDIIVVVASPKIAKMILEDNDNLDDDDSTKYEYVLFSDEPNMGADNADNVSLRDNMALMTVAPKITINSSATFPKVEMLGPIVEDFQRRYPGAQLIRVYSDEVHIGCDIFTFDWSIVVPHLGADTRAKLTNIIQNVKDCAFLGKTYTSGVVRILYEKMMAAHITDVPDVNALFEDVDNIAINKVRQIALDLLTLLATQPDTIIENVCRSHITIASDATDATDVTSPTKSDGGFKFEEDTSEEDVITDPLDYTKLGRTQNWRFQNQTLIAHPNPEQFVIQNFGGIVQDVYRSETIEAKSAKEIVTTVYKSTGDALKRYNSRIAEWEKQKLSIDKNTTADNKQDRMQEHDNIKPKFLFPSFGHIGSVEHVKKYAKSHQNDIVHRFVRSALPVPFLADDKEIMNVSDEILTALFCGIGVYSTETVRCRVYLNTVLKLASTGSLAYVVADSTICFGTNYPFSNVIITEEFSLLHSILVLFQVMGRAGRVNKSYEARIVVPDSVARRLIAYVVNLSESDIEATNMVNMFVRLKEQKKRQEQKRIDDKIASLIAPVQKKTTLTVLRTGGINLQVQPEIVVVTKIKEIVKISDVPDGELIRKPFSAKPSTREEGNWRSVPSRHDQTRSKPIDRSSGIGITRSSNTESNCWRNPVNDSQSSAPPVNKTSSTPISKNGSSYVPPHLRKTQESTEGKPPRRKETGNGAFSQGSKLDQISNSKDWRKK